MELEGEKVSRNDINIVLMNKILKKCKKIINLQALFQNSKTNRSNRHMFFSLASCH